MTGAPGEHGTHPAGGATSNAPHTASGGDSGDAPEGAPGGDPSSASGGPPGGPRRGLTLAEALLPVGVMVGLFLAGTLLLEPAGELLVASLLGAAAVAGWVAARHGAGWDAVQRATGEKLAEVLPAILILLAIGMLIATWVLSGTIPYMVYWGVQLVNPRYLALTAFLGTAVMSLFTGTSWGSAGTLGVALMGTAAALGAPLPATAGAVVSGAYLGDKLSPLSDSTNIAAIAADAPLYTHIRHMLYTALPSAVACLVVYGLAARWAGAGGPGTPDDARRLLVDLEAVFTLHWATLLPPAIVVWSIVRRVPAALAISLSALVAAGLGVGLQGFGVYEALVAAVGGFQVDMIAATGADADAVGQAFRTLVARGGLYGMAPTLVVILAAFLLAGAMDASGSLDLLMGRMLASVRSVFGLVAATMASGATLIALTSHGGVTSLVVGGLFQSPYRERGLAPENLSRSLEDSITITEPLMPWTVSAIFMATTLGVPTIAYAPWAVFCYGGPIFSLLIAATYRRTGWGLRRLAQPAVVAAVALLMAVVGGNAPVAAASTQDPQDTLVQDTLPQDSLPQDTLAQDTLAQDTLAQGSLAQEPVEAVDEERAALDEAIRNRLQAVFDRVPSLAGVDVTVDAGVVRLAGTVLSGETRTRAAELASRQDGVLFVDNRIRESTSLEEHLQPTWTRLSELGWGTLAKLPLILVALLIVALAALLGTLIARWTTPATARLGNPFLQSLIRRVLRGLLVLGGVVVALDLLDATALVGAVVGTAGLAGLALGFAFKDIVENYLAGTLLAVRQPFAKNDHVRVEGFEGKVVRLTARETILMTLDGNHVRLPNALVFRSPLVNYTRNPLRRFQFDAGVGPNDDLARARDVAVATLVDMEGVLADPPPQALVHELGDSTVTMRFMGWVDQREAGFGRVRSEAIRVVKARLEEAGLTLPSPEYLVQLGGEAAPSTAPVEPEPAPQPSPAAPPPAAAADVAPADIEIDHSVDEQIEAERRASDEEDLLDRAEKGE